MKTEKDRAIQIQNLDNDAKKLELLSTIELQSFILDIIRSMKDEDIKVEALDYAKNRVKLIVGIELKSDDKKLKALSKIEDDYIKKRIISSMKDRRKKLEAIKYIKDPVIRKIMIMYNEDEKVKNQSFKNEIEKKYKRMNLPKQMTIGIEIEAEGDNGNFLNYICEIGDWQVKHDGSLDSGIEIVSPIMHDTEENVNDIYRITEIMQDARILY